jgi:hypothetical protein
MGTKRHEGVVRQPLQEKGITMMSNAELGVGVVSVPLGCDGSLVQIHLHVHADADQDCTIDLVTTGEGIQIRLRGLCQDALRLDDEDRASADVDVPIDIDVDDLLGRWGGEEADNEAAGGEEDLPLSERPGVPADDDEAGAAAVSDGLAPVLNPLPQDDATHVYLGKLFDWTVAERVDDGVVFTRGERELFRVPEERFEEMRQLFVLEDTGLITMHVDGFRVCREDWTAHIFDGDIFFEAIPAEKFALLSRLFT